MLAVLAFLLVACDPPVDPNDPYIAEVFTTDQLSSYQDVVYGSGPDAAGNTVDMAMDIYVPPSTGSDRPVSVFVHGGGFSGGDKSSLQGPAQAMARRGWIGITLGYRLNTSSNIAARAIGGIGDGQMAVSWLRDNAATYDIDPNRISLLGSSAGGVMALGASVDIDLSAGRNTSTQSHVPNAAISTGGHITAFFEAGAFTASDTAAPILMHFYELDGFMPHNGAASTASDFFDTCLEFHANGERCGTYPSTGTGHGTSLWPGGAYMTDAGLAFLYRYLDLANAPSPT